MLDDALDIIRDICGRKADRSNASIRQPCIPPLIALWSNAHVVAVTIDLDRDGSFATEEIELVGTDRVLAAKL